MNKPEFEFMKQAIDLAHIHRWKVAHFRPGMMSNGRWITPCQADAKGFPDLFMVRDNKIMAVELKVDGGEASDAQLDWLMALDQAGAEVAVWTPEDMDEINWSLREGRIR